MPSPVSLGTVMRKRRHELGLTQEQLAVRIGDGFRQAEVSRLESNRIALPRRKRLQRIAAALELSVSDLLMQSGWAESAPSASMLQGAEDMVLRQRFERAQHRAAQLHLQMVTLRQELAAVELEIAGLQHDLD